MSKEKQLSTVLDFLLDKLTSERNIRSGIEYQLEVRQAKVEEAQDGLRALSDNFSRLYSGFCSLMATYQPDVEIGRDGDDKVDVVLAHFYRLLSANAALMVIQEQHDDRIAAMAQELHTALGLPPKKDPFGGKGDVESWWAYLIGFAKDEEDGS